MLTQCCWNRQAGLNRCERGPRGTGRQSHIEARRYHQAQFWLHITRLNLCVNTSVVGSYDPAMTFPNSCVIAQSRKRLYTSPKNHGKLMARCAHHRRC